jgi:hypothetical protein
MQWTRGQDNGRWTHGRLRVDLGWREAEALDAIDEAMAMLPGENLLSPELTLLKGPAPRNLKCRRSRGVVSRCVRRGRQVGGSYAPA